MPNKICKKISSKRGATLLLALALFLVCAMVGSVVVAAAYTNAARYANNKQAQQSYLAVMSASRLISADVENMTFEGSYVKTITEKYTPVYEVDENQEPVLDEDGNPIIVSYSTETTEEFSGLSTSLEGSKFIPKNIAPRLAKTYAYYHANELFAGTLPIGNVIMDVELAVEDFDVPAVTGTLKVYCTDTEDASHFDIVITLNDSKNSANAVTLRFPVKIIYTYDVDDEIGEDYKKTYFSYGIVASWQSPEIEKGAGA